MSRPPLDPIDARAARLAARAGIAPGDRVLDLGSPHGSLAEALRSAGAIVTWRAAHAVHEPWIDTAASYEAILSLDGLPWVGPGEARARDIARALVPGGRLAADCDQVLPGGALSDALRAALRRRGIEPERFHPWLAGKAPALADRLAGAGLRILSVEDEPALLTNALTLALAIVSTASGCLPPGARPGFLRDVLRRLEPALSDRAPASVLGLRRVACLAERPPHPPTPTA